MTIPLFDKVEKATLIEAYHLVYDAKDGAKPGSDLFQQFGTALRTLAAAMDAMGVDHPSRFDGDGRTATNGGL